MTGIFGRGHTGTTAPAMPPQPTVPSPPASQEVETPMSAPLPFARVSVPAEEMAVEAPAVAEPAVAEPVSPVVLGPTGRPVREFPDPGPVTGPTLARVISMCNQKGGVG